MYIHYTSGPLYFTTNSACILSPIVQVYSPPPPPLPPPSPLKWMATNSIRGSQFTIFWYAVEKETVCLSHVTDCLSLSVVRWQSHESHVIVCLSLWQVMWQSCFSQERATRVRACNSNRSPWSGRNLPPALKIEHWSRAHIATLTFYTACAVRVTIFSTGGKFHPVSIFM